MGSVFKVLPGPRAKPNLSVGGHVNAEGVADGPVEAKTNDRAPKRDNVTRVRSLNIVK